MIQDPNCIGFVSLNPIVCNDCNAGYALYLSKAVNSHHKLQIHKYIIFRLPIPLQIKNYLKIFYLNIPSASLHVQTDITMFLKFVNPVMQLVYHVMALLQIAV